MLPMEYFLVHETYPYKGKEVILVQETYPFQGEEISFPGGKRSIFRT